MELCECDRVARREISRILSSHQGSGRRFSVPMLYFRELRERNRSTATLDGWLLSPALDNLQELEFHYGYRYAEIRPPPPPSLRHFSSTLRVAKTTMAGEKNVWCHKYRNLVGTLDIPLKKIVLKKYRGNKSHVNFAKFFILNASLLESIFEVDGGDPSSEWTEKQDKLLQIKNKASRIAQFHFVYHARYMPFHHMGYVLAHDLLTTDPFARFDEWGKF